MKPLFPGCSPGRGGKSRWRSVKTRKPTPCWRASTANSSNNWRSERFLFAETCFTGKHRLNGWDARFERMQRPALCWSVSVKATYSPKRCWPLLKGRQQPNQRKRTRSIVVALLLTGREGFSAAWFPASATASAPACPAQSDASGSADWSITHHPQLKSCDTFGRWLWGSARGAHAHIWNPCCMPLILSVSDPLMKQSARAAPSRRSVSSLKAERQNSTVLLLRLLIVISKRNVLPFRKGDLCSLLLRLES